MKPLQLDFSNLKQRSRQRSNLVIVVLLTLVLLGLMLEFSHIKSKSSDVENSIAAIQKPKSASQAKPTEQDLRQMAMAKAVQEKLNFPWQQLLAAIELVKQQTKTVELMAIQPNPAKSEVLISAEAPDLQAMLAFVSLLEEQAIFHDAFLVNQRRLELNGNDSLLFTLKIGWEA